MKQQNAYTKNTVSVIRAVLFLVIVLMPFHAFLTTWIGSNTGHLLVVRGWKEVLLIVMTLLSASLLVRDQKLRRAFLGSRVVQAMLLFTAWILAVTALHGRELVPVLTGLTIQLRIVAIFFVGWIVAFYQPPSKQLLEKLVLLPGVGVIAVGLLQMFVLPYDFLRHFGYQKNTTIPPFFTIDDQVEKLRYASTLRGPNPLGVYLILPLLTLASALWARRRTLVYTVGFCAALVVLYASQSRGAWLGAAAALGIWILLSVGPKLRTAALLAGSVVVVLGAGAVYQFRTTSFVENVVLHNSPEAGGEVDSNAGHANALKEGLQDVKQRPLTGCGAGCAGPASAHATVARISENYYIQTAQEAGLVGAALLIVVFGLVAKKLFEQNDPTSRVLLATFIGVCVASLSAHAWADDTIAYIWWALAGLVISQSRQGSATASAKRQRTSGRAS
jgi:hypothetical protein